ncbi:MAG: (d)CMP kinase [Gemmatimonadota bacterium]|jgi:cytidylate kinase|nr:(d)CMP kinase [Gemmatimonadota bacterium]MDQ8147072.1 (d)CMP kinase [Gemmatimonadota bacterium]MDQ8157145.1 (d)CMP kinase [Gemmatimonadota bacterium]
MRSMPATADPSRPLVIAIDGPAASGKSSTAKRVAAALGIRHVDSGALYRAATAAMLRLVPDETTWTEAAVLAAAQAVTLEPVDGTFRPLLDGAAAEAELRGVAVTSRVSVAARMPGVRAWANAMIRSAAAAHPVVVDGRDMGSVVFPEAAVKVFLVADPQERARRRLLERHGREPSPAEVAAEVAELVRRDVADAAQTIEAPGAVRIDTTGLTPEGQVERIVALARGVDRS